MTVEAWDYEKNYVHGDQALVAGVPCQVVALDLIGKANCRYCPKYTPCRDDDHAFDGPVRTGCLRSLGDSAFWVPIEAMPLLRLKGEL